MSDQISVRRLTVNAIVLRDSVVLVDPCGRPLSKRKRLTEIEGILDPSAVVDWEWRESVRRMKYSLSTSNECLKTPWQKKTESLAQSLRIRARLPRAKARSRRRFERYSTRTWSDACKRLWTQGNNRFRRHSRNGWARWTHTVSNNHNRKKGGRYAHARYCDRQENHGAD